MNETKSGATLGKTLGEFETIRINFKDREEHMFISGNGEVRYDLVNVGESHNIFKYAEHSNQAMQNAVQGYNPHNRHEDFSIQERYLEALVRVASVSGHKVHEEIDEAIKKLKEITYA